MLRGPQCEGEEPNCWWQSIYCLVTSSSSWQRCPTGDHLAWLNAVTVLEGTNPQHGKNKLEAACAVTDEITALSGRAAEAKHIAQTSLRGMGTGKICVQMAKTSDIVFFLCHSMDCSRMAHGLNITLHRALSLYNYHLMWVSQRKTLYVYRCQRGCDCVGWVQKVPDSILDCGRWLQEEDTAIQCCWGERGGRRGVSSQVSKVGEGVAGQWVVGSNCCLDSKALQTTLSSSPSYHCDWLIDWLVLVANLPNTHFACL